MGFSAQGSGPVIKITGTKERRQFDNAVGTWLEKRGVKNINSLHQKWKIYIYSIYIYFKIDSLVAIKEEQSY